MPSLSIIIPQYGKSQLTIDAVRSLQQFHSGDFEIIVVDDGSPPTDRYELQRRISGRVTILPLRRRSGVTAAWNRGAEVATGNGLVFLNNDTLTHGEWLSAFEAGLQQKGILAVAPQGRLEKTLPGSVRQLLAGWCFGIFREQFKQFSGFDERFRLYFSDTDFLLRLQNSSPHSLRVLGPLPLRHLGHRSTQTLTSRSREWHQDRIRFIQKWNEMLTEDRV